jgi:transmembrane sensor
MKNDDMAGLHNREDIHTLIADYLSGTADHESVEKLNEWVSESAENKKYYQHLKNIWELAHHEINPAELDTERAYEKVQDKLSLHRKKTLFLNILMRAAAILLLPLLATSYFLGIRYAGGLHDRKQVYNEVSSAFGTRSMISLSDGSKVWLNSGSHLRYPREFVTRKREVYLTGEGYFEVESNPRRPFIVHTQRLNVTATGTKFNVNVSRLEKASQVTLVSGKVLVSKNLSNGKTVEISHLSPDDHLAFDTLSEKVEIQKENTYKYIAWKDGKLIFRNEPLEEVIRKIGYFYNVDIELKDEKLKEYRYRATFEEESLEEILNLLKMSSPVDYREIKRQPLPDGSFPRKKIVLFPAQKRPG